METPEKILLIPKEQRVMKATSKGDGGTRKDFVDLPIETQQGINMKRDEGSEGHVVIVILQTFQQRRQNSRRKRARCLEDVM